MIAGLIATTPLVEASATIAPAAGRTNDWMMSLTWSTPGTLSTRDLDREEHDQDGDAEVGGEDVVGAREGDVRRGAVGKGRASSGMYALSPAGAASPMPVSIAVSMTRPPSAIASHLGRTSSIQ